MRRDTTAQEVVIGTREMLPCGHEKIRALSQRRVYFPVLTVDLI
jgi:hypothetical protein